MSVLPLMIAAPSASIARRMSTAPAGTGPLMARSPATATRSGFSLAMAFLPASSAVRPLHECRLLLGDGLPDRLERDGVAVDVGQNDDPGHRRTPSPGMMKDK